MGASPLPVFGSTDLLLMGILRPFFEGTGVHVGTLFAKDMVPPLVIARRDRKSGTTIAASRDEHGLRPVLVAVSTISAGLEAEASNEHLQEAVHHAIMMAVRNQTVIPGVGHIAAVQNSSPYSRASDRQSSTGAVQYAQLPKEWTRYEAIYRLMLRPLAVQSQTKNPYITPLEGTA